MQKNYISKVKIFLGFVTTTFLLLIWHFHTTNCAPSNDEIWGYPAAVSFYLGQSHNLDNEISILGKPFPLATGPYMGAVKVYLLAPWFFVFGFGFKSLLGINLVLAVLLYVSACWAIKPLRSEIKNLEWVTAFFLLLPLVDVHFAMSLVTDYGPILIQLICLTLGLGFLLRGLIAPSRMSLVAATFVLGVCINDKATSAPHVLALLLSFSIVSILRIRNGLFLVRMIPYALVAGILGALPFLIYLAKVGIEPMFAMVYSGTDIVKQPYSQRFIELASAFWRYSNSNYFVFVSGFDQEIKPDIPRLLTFWPFYSVFLSLILYLVWFLRQAVGRELRNTLMVVVFLSLALFLSIILQSSVAGLNRAWHILLLYPLLAMLLGITVAVLPQLLPGKKIYPIALGLLVLIFFQCEYSFRSLHGLASSKGVNTFSPAIREVTNKLINIRPTKIISLNYSVKEPIYVLSGGRVNAEDLTWWQRDDVLKRLNSDHSVSHIIYRIPVNTDPNNKAAFDFINGHTLILDGLIGYNEVFRIQDEKGTVFVVLERS